MRPIPNTTRQERHASDTDLPSCFPDILDDHVVIAGLIRFASGAQHEGDQRRRRSNMVRRASILSKFSPIISTEQCHRDDEAPFRGPFAHLRQELDYTYHLRYRKERQWLQDSIIEDMLEANPPDDLYECITPTEPWLVFTVGPRGAGKKHVLNQLVREERFPVLTFVRVDPDEIRRRLPEFDYYSSQSHCLVDELTRKESGFIAELLLLAALQNGRNVVLDGCMSDPAWHVKLVEKLRERYEKLRFGIIHITAPTKLLLERARKKSHDTGRDVTQDAVLSYIKRIEDSVAFVKPHIDFYSKIHNGPGTLELLLGMEWDEFHNNFLQTCAWQPGMQGKQRLMHDLSEQEMTATRNTSIKHARRTHRRFSVLISSEENNRSNDLKFHGKFSHIRETLDYNYHRNYTFERQKLQDAVIDDMLDAALIYDVDGKIGSVPTEPWIVFTAGAMGAGKSHTMSVLVEKGRFPLKAFVVVDPDEIRHLLPEYHMYVDHNPEQAGELTRKEAGFISEILTLAALRRGNNVLQDGSLRDADWYKAYLARLKEEFPAVRQAILHVTAPREAVFQRAATRAMETGRVVPKEVLEAALEQVPRSVEVLSPLVDYYAELNNAEEVELVKPEGSTWKEFREVWNQRVAYEDSRSRRKILKVLGNNGKLQTAAVAENGSVPVGSSRTQQLFTS